MNNVDGHEYRISTHRNPNPAEATDLHATAVWARERQSTRRKRLAFSHFLNRILKEDHTKKKNVSLCKGNMTRMAIYGHDEYDFMNVFFLRTGEAWWNYFLLFFLFVKIWLGFHLLQNIFDYFFLQNRENISVVKFEFSWHCDCQKNWMYGIRII